MLNRKDAVHVEIRLKPGNIRIESIELHLRNGLNNYFEKYKDLLVPGEATINSSMGAFIQEHAENISIERDTNQGTDYEIKYYIYRPNKRNVEVEMFEADQDAGEEEVPASNHWLLPFHNFVGLWESLIYEENLKEKLLRFAESSLVFSRYNVNQNVISCNRILLLHGPPGTGKTSLCKAIAQKLSIRLMPMYKYTHLIEINSHSLFSKWFSESGKLVMKLFTRVRDIIAQPNSLVCVLIDEVESIAYARDAMSSQEPKDAMRVVNAFLTQLDSIKEFPNVLILVTSNLAASIDLAFLDRADIKQHIGLPSARAIYQIYVSALEELMRVGIVISEPLMPFNVICGNSLLILSAKSVGVSGRTLRKLPFLAHAMHLSDCIYPVAIETFIQGMDSALQKHLEDQVLVGDKKCE